ncbi:alpha/beta hydrolase [Tenacibaculum xiamenense]|uniref:alpha/beta hydrolase n=1 Tax=Tenacibaculum xiamenense TaxID=1261553 RepID=UPI0038945477
MDKKGKKKLIILSDLWGGKDIDWIYNYVLELRSKFEIVFYDIRELADIDVLIEGEELIHKQLVNGGIDKAVAKLKIEEQGEGVIILGFSVGGTIGWRYAAETGLVSSLVCVSSTRLRYEKVKPSCKIDLYFGNKDIYAPDNDWFEELGVNKMTLEGGHIIYKKESFSKFICFQLLQ